jgi:hypothetical protein
MSIIRERPFWERQRDKGPVTNVIAQRRRDEDRFLKQRAKQRRPDAHMCERCSGYCADYECFCENCGKRHVAAPPVMVRDASAVVRRAEARVD